MISLRVIGLGQEERLVYVYIVFVCVFVYLGRRDRHHIGCSLDGSLTCIPADWKLNEQSS